MEIFFRKKISDFQIYEWGACRQPHFSDFGFENGLNRLYTIVYVFFRLYTSYFSSSPRGAGDMLSFSDFGFENGLNRLYFVCTRLYTYFFVFTPPTFLPLPWGLGTGYPPYSDLGFKNGLNRLYFVCTRLYTYFFVCTPLTFLPIPGGWGHAIPLFWFRIQKWAQSFVLRLYTIVTYDECIVFWQNHLPLKKFDKQLMVSNIRTIHTYVQ